MLKNHLSRMTLLFVVCMTALAGCVTKPPADAPSLRRPENLSGQNMAGAEKLADDYMAGFIAGVKAKDFALFEQAMPDEAKGKVTAEMFDTMCSELRENLGTLSAAEYLGELDQTLVRDYLWKLTFEKTLENPEKQPDVLRREVVYMVRIGKIDGTFHIAGSGFRF